MTSPPLVRRRIEKLLRSGFKGTMRQISEKVFGCKEQVRTELHYLKSSGFPLRIGGWAKSRATTAAIYEYDPQRRPDIPKPLPMNNSTKAHRYRAKLRASFGKETAERILQAMQEPNLKATIIQDGRIVYRKGEGVRWDLVK